ncbi:GNAT family N-acetyltransferase [Marinicrinis lubricantis]|uniref:GNAT family N-acetyltransferase n=1 Tax=Marinicrinis lubricantis TaxID=2086470 RepID=A0ABW1ISZ6_9BACL
MLQIKRSHSDDYGLLADIWLNVSLKAHDFIDSAYWTSNKMVMQEMYLPQSETYVGWDQGQIIGFISMVEKHLAALFIDEAHQCKGYGRQFMEYVKKDRETITLRVYVKNEAAYRFYLKQGFVIAQEQMDEGTNEREYEMVWKRKAEKIEFI